ncbi:MAG: DNA translocase FtsK 4TM domain-containing protein [Gemmobacter sp.]
MASYQVRQRDPLLDQTTQAMLERRGRELLGVAAVCLGLAFAALLSSYSPDDPGWMVVTDEPAQNLLGRLGAAIASTLMIVGGLGSWGIPLILLAWGARFVLHRGTDRVLSRSVFAVIAVALASIFAATHVPGPDWPHAAIGLGGLFGDTVLGAALTVVPVGTGFGLKLLSLAFGAGLVAMLLFVAGFDLRELRSLGAFLATSLVRSYAALLVLAGQGAAGTARAAQALQAARTARRTAPAVPAPVVAAPPPLRASPARLAAPQRPAPPPPEAPPARGSLLGLIRRTTQAEPSLTLIDTTPPEDDDRVRARIADAIRARVRPQPVIAPSAVSAAIARREPSLHRQTPRPPAPAPRAATPRIEPPVTAAPRTSTLPPPPQVLPTFDEADDDAWPAPELVDDIPAFARHPAPPAPDAKKLVQPPARKAAPPSRQAMAEAQPRLRFDDGGQDYALPPLALLANPATVTRHALSEEALEENARMLESVLDDYGVKGEIVSVRPGPVVTMYELEPAPGVKASRVIGLADDIARSMSALSARVSTVPGRSVIGIELPNATREKVVLREILAARDFGDSNLRLPLALGKDIGGDPIVANLAKMPHLLIAGTTGSGKSVAINTMILSLLYKLTPEECRLIMIDPKMLELSVYDGIPHLLSPVVTDPKKAVVALKWVVGEMEERYRKMSRMGVRNIEGYNGRVREALAKGEMFKRTIQTGFDDDTGEPVFETEEDTPVAIPYIVVVVDEMADLMMVAGKEIEACIQRLAQMARASGIHLIMATQRPSVDVITGTIKANFPTRISFQVTSKIDSRTILGEQGAEQLLGMGDMLYMAGGGRISRIHGPFVSDEEVEEIVNHLKSYGPPAYMSGVVEGPDEEKEADIDAVLGLGGEAGDDTLYDQAVAVVAKDRKCSTSYIQRKLGIGYNKAAKLVEQMEDQGVVTRANHVGKREILVEER